MKGAAMNAVIGQLFEPLLFLVFLGSTGLMTLSPAHRRYYRHARASHRTGCSLIKALRYTSKQATREIPWFLPCALLIGGLPGVLLGNPATSLGGVATILLALMLLPIVAPIPSVATELSESAR